MLVAAFRATLEEVLEADIILHVRDISHAETEEQAGDVMSVLKDLGISDERRASIIEVWNKIDLVDAERRAVLMEESGRKDNVLVISAITGEGVPAMLETLEETFAAHNPVMIITLEAGEGADLAWLYEHAEVLNREAHDDGRVSLTARFDERQTGSALKRFGDRILPVSMDL
jgi:GTP-binding protein HflX